MSKLFLATSFSGQVNPETGRVKPEFRKSIEDILRSLREIGGFTVFCAAEYEGWVMGNGRPEVGVAKDKAEIDTSDGLLAILQPSPSEGVQWEVGYACGQEKTVFITSPLEMRLGYFNEGLVSLGAVKHLFYETPELLAEQIRGKLA